MANETKAITVTVSAKAKSGKSFLANDEWYNVLENVKPYLEKINKGDVITINFYKKGVANYVTMIKKGSESAPEAEAPESTTGFKCIDCGKELKDGKYKKCFMCNKKNPAKKEETSTGTKETKTYNSYDNPTKTAQIMKGNSLNAAAAVSAGQGFSDPDAAVQFTLIVAERFLEWLKAE